MGGHLVGGCRGAFLPFSLIKHLLPYLALSCLAAAAALFAGFRWLAGSDLLEPGDDTPFVLLLCVPLPLLLGSGLSWGARARGWGSRSVATLALVANAGTLFALSALVAFALASYSGR